MYDVKLMGKSDFWGLFLLFLEYEIWYMQFPQPQKFPTSTYRSIMKYNQLIFDVINDEHISVLLLY